MDPRVEKIRESERILHTEKEERRNMTDRKEIGKWLNKEILNCMSAMEYAGEHLDEIVEAAHNETVKVIYTTNADKLGVACPDPIAHRVVGGSKKGRVLKEIPKDTDYCEFGYDEKDRPRYMKKMNSFGNGDTAIFFEYNSSIYVVDLERIWSDGKYTRKLDVTSKKYMYRYDEKGRIKLFADEISYPHEIPDGFPAWKGIEDVAHVIAYAYEYPADESQPILCHRYRYVTHLSVETGESIEGEDKKTQLTEAFYEITRDLKTITEYEVHENGQLEFSRTIESKGKKSTKPMPATDTYEKFALWLDEQLSGDSPRQGGIYFDLFEPTEDGFGVYFSVTKDYTPEDDEWACDVVYSSDRMLMIGTNGQMEYEAVLTAMVKLIKEYLKEGKYREILRKHDGIGTAFSDGDIVYINKS